MVNAGRGRGESGFTLLEMMIVIAIIGILVGIALPRFQVSLVLAREAVLKEDLFRFREAIDQYHADKGRYPATLQTLADEGYLRRVEPDPMTGAPDWTEVQAETNADNPEEQPGVYDVHSSSTALAVNGQAYNEW